MTAHLPAPWDLTSSSMCKSSAVDQGFFTAVPWFCSSFHRRLHWDGVRLSKNVAMVFHFLPPCLYTAVRSLSS